MKTAEGHTVVPEEVGFRNEWITMSSQWKDERMKAWNVIKTNKFNANWGKGEFTCIHTMNDKDGAWW